MEIKLRTVVLLLFIGLWSTHTHALDGAEALYDTNESSTESTTSPAGDSNTTSTTESPDLSTSGGDSSTTSTTESPDLSTSGGDSTTTSTTESPDLSTSGGDSTTTSTTESPDLSTSGGDSSTTSTTESPDLSTSGGDASTKSNTDGSELSTSPGDSSTKSNTDNSELSTSPGDSSTTSNTDDSELSTSGGDSSTKSNTDGSELSTSPGESSTKSNTDDSELSTSPGDSSTKSNTDGSELSTSPGDSSTKSNTDDSELSTSPGESSTKSNTDDSELSTSPGDSSTKSNTDGSELSTSSTGKPSMTSTNESPDISSSAGDSSDGTPGAMSTPDVSTAPSEPTTTPKPTTTKAPGQIPPNLDGKFKNITSSMKFEGGWNDDLNSTSSPLYQETKTQIETQLEESMAGETGFAEAIVTRFKREDTPEPTASYGALQAVAYNTNGLLAEFSMAYNLADCVSDPEGVAASMNKSIDALKSVNITAADGTEIQSNSNYIDMFAAEAVKQASDDVTDPEKLGQEVCGSNNTCPGTHDCSYDAANKKLKVDCFDKCFPQGKKHPCIDDFEGFIGSEGLAVCFLEPDATRNYTAKCGCLSTAYNTGSKCLLLWWIVGPAAGGALLLIIIFSIVICVIKSKKAQKAEMGRKPYSSSLYMETPMDDRISDYNRMDDEPQKLHRDETINPMIRAEPPQVGPSNDRKSEAYSADETRAPPTRDDTPLTETDGPRDDRRDRQGYDNRAYDNNFTGGRVPEQDHYYTELVDQYKDFTPKLDDFDTKPFKIQRPTSVYPPAATPYATADVANRYGTDDRNSSRF